MQSRIKIITGVFGLLLLSMLLFFIYTVNYNIYIPLAASKRDVGIAIDKLSIEQDLAENISVCVDKSCRDHLNEYEKLLYVQCLGRVQKLSGGETYIKDGGCRFLVTKSRKPVALISFPGSGNTWVRQLLETSSGICTGSVMCDMSLRHSGFIGENINSGSTLVVKSHDSVPLWLTEPLKATGGLQPYGDIVAYESAIIIIRNPFDALVAEWNRRVANNFNTITIFLHAHTKRGQKKDFGINSKWNEFVHTYGQQWKDTIINWVLKGQRIGRKILVVYYEDIKRDSEGQTKRMLDFLGIESLHMHNVTDNLSKFHRNYKNSFDPFTPKQRKCVVSIIKRTIHIINDFKMSEYIKLEQYL